MYIYIYDSISTWYPTPALSVLMRVTWIIHMCHDSFTPTWLIHSWHMHMCHITHSYVIWLIHVSTNACVDEDVCIYARTSLSARHFLSLLLSISHQLFCASVSLPFHACVCLNYLRTLGLQQSNPTSIFDWNNTTTTTSLHIYVPWSSPLQPPPTLPLWFLRVSPSTSFSKTSASVLHVCVPVCMQLLSWLPGSTNGSLETRQPHWWCHVWMTFWIHYGVATISRLLKMIGLFCKRAL